MLNFKPMLAATLTEEDFPKLRFPLFVQPKLDGIRCLIYKGKILSRTLKLIPNRHIRNKLRDMYSFDANRYNHLIDGEIMLNGVNKTFQDITSAVMSIEGEPDFNYQIFDRVELNSQFNREYIFRHGINIINVPTRTVENVEQMLEQESSFLKEGYEGIILRSANSPYKFGRSTLREQYLMKLKRFCDGEAKILFFNPLEINLNPTEIDERGYITHTKHKSGMYPARKLGALIVVGVGGEFDGKMFQIGTGFDDKMRTELWENRGAWRDKIIKYKYQKHGVKDLPRCPVFLGERKDI